MSNVDNFNVLGASELALAFFKTSDGYTNSTVQAGTNLISAKS